MRPSRALPVLLAVVLAAAVHATASAGPQPLELLTIAPSGDDVPQARQIVFTFDRPVVPLGRMMRDAAEIPVTIEPAVACEWRWLDRTSLACQLAARSALRRATTYRVTLEPGLRAEDGATTARRIVHEFTTARPEAREWVEFREWRSLGLPVMRVSFNQTVRSDSVRRALAFRVNGQRLVGARLERAPDDRDWWYGEEEAEVQPDAPKAEDDPTPPAEARAFLVLPERELPGDADVELVIEPGVVGVEGPEPSRRGGTLTSFATFPPLRFLGVRCRDGDLDDVSHSAALASVAPGRTSTATPCNPLGGAMLEFSAPVPPEQVRDHVLFTPDLRGGRADYDPWADSDGRFSLRRAHRRDERYPVWIPELLRADDLYRITSPRGALKDAFGRPLESGIDIGFRTAPRAPNLVFDADVAALEQAEDSDLPVYVTNLGELRLRYRALTAAGVEPVRNRVVPLPRVKDVAFATPLGVREMLGGRSGVLTGALDSTPSVRRNGERERQFFVQVTPWQVHVKIGHHNTLVWITDLKTGKPVPGATVSIALETYAAIGAAAPLRSTTSDAQGMAALPGTAQLDPKLEHRYVYRPDERRFVVTVRKGDGAAAQMAVVPLDNKFELETYQASNGTVWSETAPLHGHLRAWGTTAQGVYRAGETVQFKVWVRDQDNRTLVAPPLTGWALEVVDPTDTVVHKVDAVTLSEFGGYAGEFKVGAQAPVGWYQFKLTHLASERGFWPMRVLIADFTPSPFRVTAELNGDLFQQGDALQVTTQARLHAGGPYGKADARVTVTVDPQPLDPKDPVAAGFWFDTEGGRGSATVHQAEAALDAAGDLVTKLELPDAKATYGRLTVESAVRDERGKYVAGAASATWHGRERYVGVRLERWVHELGKPATVQWLVLDARTQRVADSPVDLVIERRETKGVRAKSAGNAYLMQYTSEWVAAAECHGVSTLAPQDCAFTPDKPGTYRVTAKVKDGRGREHASSTTLWVAGPGRVMWEEPNEGGVRLVPEKGGYQPGEKARVLVQNPFPGATALISIERYGVLRAWTQVLKDSTALIEFPVEPDYVPGFYLSVVIASPRAADAPLEGGVVDLGKPTLRMGYVELKADERAKRLVVSASADRASYRPQSEVKVTLAARVAPAAGAKPGAAPAAPPPIEYAVVVIDEAVFDLNAAGASYYDPHRGLWALDGLDLRNFNLLQTLVGRRKFEKKGANPGGDGALDFTPRSDFKYVAYWNPALRAAADGSAAFSFKVPDNLTSWRVFAMAVTPGDRLGLGTVAFKVNRPTEVRPVMPNQVMGGDRFEAGFSVMNRTDAPRTLEVVIDAGGALAADQPRRSASVVELGPFERRTVTMPVATLGSGKVDFRARAGDAVDRDGLAHAVPVLAPTPSESATTWGSTAQADAKESILFPAAMQPGVGALKVTVAPTVLGALDGAFRYQREYPHQCWEQRLGRGLAGLQFTRLSGYLAPETKWPNALGEFRTMLDDAAGYQAPNGGMSFWIPRDEYVSPYLSAYTALAFGWARRFEQAPPAAVEDRLLGYLDALLKRNVMPSFWDAGMSATVRAVALDALAERGRLARADLERYRAQLPRMSLLGKAHMLHAATRVPGAEAVAADAFEQLMARSNRSAGKSAFLEELDDGYGQLLTTPLRDQCAALSALVAYGATPAGKDKVGNLPFTLVRTIVAGRGNRDHWENTQENAFCMTALIDYAAVHEQVAPDLTATVRLDAEPLGQTSFKALRDPPRAFLRPLAPSDAGRKATLDIVKSGPGRIYYAATLSWIPTGADARATNAGIDVRREYSVKRDGAWQLLREPFELARGELVRVDLYLDLPSTRHFVAVVDPVPGGLEPVNRDLATASGVDADEGRFKAAGGSLWFARGDWNEFAASSWSFYHRELRFDSARFYADYLPPGAYHLSYTAQAIAPGKFSVGPARAEEMYDPDVFGRSAPATLDVVGR